MKQKNFSLGHIFKMAYFTKTQRINIKRWVREILVPVEAEKILKDEKLTPHQKGDRIYKLFYSTRYPELSAAQEKFKKITEKIFRNTGARIRLADQYFESNQIIVEPKEKIPDVEKFRTDLESVINWKPVLK